MRRLLVKTLVGLVIVVLLALATVYLFARRSLPQTSGTVAVPGITAPVDIVRDADNIPHIFAANKLDALFGLGYVHAQDRLWQMEFQRRIGHGRLSEMFGTATVTQDRFLRTVGFGRAARAAWERLPEGARRQLDAYVAGVNAFLSGRRAGTLPPEFVLLGVEPEPWSGPDVIAWVKMMAWDLSANYSFELLRHDLVSHLGVGRMAELMPPYPHNASSIVGTTAAARPPDTDARSIETPRPRTPSSAPDRTSWSAAFAETIAKGQPDVARLLLGGQREGLGSNNWVVGGSLTASGKPLLANDPHLATNIPSLWYLAHISAPGFEVIGATLPGAPAVAIGRNRFIAWGETNVAADVEDLYLEKLNDDGTAAEFKGRWEPLQIMSETIRVSGGDDITLKVRISRHGPLVSDAINADGTRAPIEPLAFRWTALDDDDRTVVAFLQLNEARNWGEFTAALREFVAPSQNFVYADVEGHIGYYAPGRVPARARGDGSRPVDGWSGDHEWVGYVPFEELPHLFDPPSQVIVTANQRPMPPDYPHLIGLEFPDPYRADRVFERLAGANKLTPDDFRSIQADTVSLHARHLLPVLLRSADPPDAVGREALEILRAWDFDARADSSAAAIFQAWFLRLAPTLVGDELDDRVLRAYQSRFSYVTRFVISTLEGDGAHWCDDVRTDRRESCRDAVTKALEDGLAQLKERMGGDARSWRWDGVHRAVFPHQGLDTVGLLRPLLSRAVPNVGDWSTVNVGTVDAATPFDQRSIPGYRQIVDLSPANDSRFIDAVGQSGHFLSRYYDDFLEDWQAVRHRPMRMDRAAIELGAIGTLRLVAKSEG
jgi:penicillin amidase